MSVVVRRATKIDAPIIAEFAMKLVEQHVGYDPIRFARLGDLEGMARFYGGQTEAQDAAVLVAEVEGRPAGFAYIRYEARNYAELSEKTARLHDIYIDETVRREGAGKSLVEGAVEVAKEFGASKLILSVAAQNSAAQAFFERSGFRTTMHEMMLVVGD